MASSLNIVIYLSLFCTKRDIIRTEYVNVGPGNFQELASEEDYMKMSGGRVSVLFRVWVGCKSFLKISFAHHCLNVGASALHARLAYFFVLH